MNATNQTIETFLKNVQAMIAPVSGTVTHGNVRQQVSEWGGEKPVTNIAIIYESPGGSTNQINISFDHTTGFFRALNESTGNEELVEDSGPILQRVESLLQTIPEIRMKRLRWDIDRWVDDGKAQSQILATLSRLLQADSGLKGGGITQDELKEAARYVAQRFKEKKTDEAG